MLFVDVIKLTLSFLIIGVYVWCIFKGRVPGAKAEDEALRRLEKQHVDNWVEYYDQLNSWGMPGFLKDLAPVLPNHRKLKDPEFEKYRDFIRPIMKRIKARLGMKAILKMHNMDNMTSAEFEKFWSEECQEMHNV